jgi:hypothetical protein
VSQLIIAGGAPWSRVVFTTYALSLTFFETIVLDALVRARAKQVLILSDVEGVRASLSEKGVRGAGRDYLVEPVAVSGGVFHPKIGAFVAEDQAMLTVGSGNLTFGGWAGNLELVERLHSDAAPSAFRDASALFEAMAEHPRLRHSAAEACHELSRDLAGAVRNRTDSGEIRLLHGLGQSLIDQIRERAEELGGATRLSVVSPYFDDGGGVARLAAALGLSEVQVHWHGKVASGTAPNWPRTAPAQIQPMRLDFLAADTRVLHAKAYEGLCRKGRLVISGSANASDRALGADGNVEAVILRTQHGRRGGWSGHAVDAPVMDRVIAAEVSEAHETVGVLRAELRDASLMGWILTPAMRGRAVVEQLTSLGAAPLGETVIDDAGRFRLEAAGLEAQAWNAGRLVLRVRCSAHVAEGYAASTAAGAVARRIGAMAPRLFAILGGSETPDDIVALLDWIFDDPERLLRLGGGGTAGRQGQVDDGDLLLPVEDIVWSPAPGAASSGYDRDGAALVQAIRQLRRMLRGHKGAYERPETADVGDEQSATQLKRAEDQQRRHDARLAASEGLTEDFLRWALEPDQVVTWGVFALELLNHMAQRLDWTPAVLRHWLSKVAGALTPEAIPEADRPLVAGSILALVGSVPAERVRAAFVRMRLPLDGEAPSADDASLYACAGGDDLAADWSALQDARSIEETVGEFVHALKNPDTADHKRLLASPLRTLCPEQWPVLAAALSSDRARRQVLFGRGRQFACPKCSMVLPTSDADSYRTRMVATARNCGHGVIIFDGTLA